MDRCSRGETHAATLLFSSFAGAYGTLRQNFGDKMISSFEDFFLFRFVIIVVNMMIKEAVTVS